MSAKNVLILTAVLFVGGVIGLLTYGRDFLHKWDMCNNEVCYLDLARQASGKNNYVLAHFYYEQALNYARQSDPTGQAEGAMLLTYGKFAIDKLHDKPLAERLQRRAMELRKQQAVAQGSSPDGASAARTQ